MTIVIVILIILAIVLALSGIIGAIVPAIPGPPLCFASLLIAYFTCPDYVSTELIIWMLGLTIFVSVLDYVAPIWLTKLGGGSKAAIWGSTLGLFAGLFFMPIGLIIGPLAGAFIGEMMNEASLGKATKVALMSFIAFLLTTGFKLVLSGIMTFYTMAAICHRSVSFFDNHSFWNIFDFSFLSNLF